MSLDSLEDMTAINAERLLEAIRKNEALPADQQLPPTEVVSTEDLKALIVSLRANRRSAASTTKKKSSPRLASSLSDLLNTEL